MPMRSQFAAETGDTERALTRRLRDLREISNRLKRAKMTPLQVCQAIIENRLLDGESQQFFAGLPHDEKHYWVASLYALLMPKGRRRQLAVYFTPPQLVEHAIDALIEAGFDPCKHRTLDPASGGAAFLVPLARRIALALRERGRDSGSILETIESRLEGVEIEPHLTKLSHLLLADLLHDEIVDAGRSLNVKVLRANALKQREPERYFDAIIGNPPYGRIFRPSKELLTSFAPVITHGYVNLYALFIEQAIRWVRPGGIISLIVPTSFIGGPNFGALRKRILQSAQVQRVDPVDKRSDVFLDVLYDVCTLVLKKKNGEDAATMATSSLLRIGASPQELGHLDLPQVPSNRVWALPDGMLDDQLFHEGLETLADYGYVTRTGYFVWNRERHRHRSGFKPRPTEVPLYWAHNIRANRVCAPLDGEHGSQRIGLVKIPKDSSAIVRTDALLLQRTTNRRQKRRLVAGVIRQKSVPGGQGFVCENHTILVLPDPVRPQRIPLRTLCRLLNTAAVDGRFRRISGSVSVSTKALRELPLPAVSSVLAAFLPRVPAEEAASEAYAASLTEVNENARRSMNGSAQYNGS